MTAEERAQVAFTARLLRATAVLPWLAGALTVVAAAAVVVGRGVAAAIPALLLGIVAVFYGIRVALDARLLDDVAAGRLTAEDIDVAIRSFRRVAGGRSWEARCRGARRLAAVCAAATAAQIVAVACIAAA